MLKNTLAAGAALGILLAAAATAQADAKFVYRHNGKMPTLMAAAVPEVPEAPEGPEYNLTVSVTNAQYFDFGGQPGVLDTSGDRIQLEFLVQNDGQTDIEKIDFRVNAGAFGEVTASCMSGGQLSPGGMTICQAIFIGTADYEYVEGGFLLTQDAIDSLPSGTTINHSFTGSVVGITSLSIHPENEYVREDVVVPAEKYAANGTISFDTPA